MADVIYRADGERRGQRQRWTPSIFMRRAQSRISLEVVSVRIERLHAIDEDDAKREGVRPFFEGIPNIGRDQRLTTGELCSAAPHRASFAMLWDQINARRALWTSNPWVRRVEFRIDERADFTGRERPILFSAPMVRAILRGTKTVTRRLVTDEHASEIDVWRDNGDGTWDGGIYGEGGACARMMTIGCPYGAPGDRLWVRETFAVVEGATA